MMPNDNTNPQLGSNTAEEVAFKLLRLVATAEGKTLGGSASGAPDVGRRYILDTYAECLAATKGYRTLPPVSRPEQREMFGGLHPDNEPFDQDD